MGRPLFDGAKVFDAVDTHGVPLDFLLVEMRKRGRSFDVLAFCCAARKSGNWAPARLYRLLQVAQQDSGGEFTPEMDTLVKAAILRAWSTHI